jgi:hypothetical protein
MWKEDNAMLWCKQQEQNNCRRWQTKSRSQRRQDAAYNLVQKKIGRGAKIYLGAQSGKLMTLLLGIFTRETQQTEASNPRVTNSRGDYWAQHLSPKLEVILSI